MSSLKQIESRGTQSAFESLTIQVERVIYRKEDSNWYILKPTQGPTCKGTVGFEVKEGSMLQLTGRRGKSSFNGEDEFTFKSAVPYLPDDALALLHYACEITKGIGDSKEALIWAKYGEAWQSQEELDIPGLTAGARARWKQTLAQLQENRAMVQALSFLMAHGCTLNMATAAWTMFGNTTVGMVKANLYVLTELPRYGFGIVDRDVRPYFDIPDDDPRRVDAAILYSIGQLTDQGSTVMPWDDVAAKTAELVPVPVGGFEQGVQRLAEGKKMMMLDGRLLTLVRDYEAEDAVYKRFCK